MPQASSVAAALGASPCREGVETIVEREARSAAFFAADVPGVRAVDLSSGGGAGAGLDVELDDALSGMRQSQSRGCAFACRLARTEGDVERR
jgi:hypothetical protein